jgi:hypothetical protein
VSAGWKRIMVEMVMIVEIVQIDGIVEMIKDK